MKTTTGDLVADVLDKPAAVVELLGQLDDLVTSHQLPITVTGRWLLGCINRLDHVWAVTVSQPGQGLQAAAVFVDERDASQTTLVGAVDGHTAAIPSLSVHAVEELARATAVTLKQRTLDRQRMIMGPLRLDHTTACLISALYGSVRVIPAEPIPALRKGGDRDVTTYLSPGTRKTLRKATNRLHTDHRKVEYEFTSDPDLITALSPQLIDARRARDDHHAIDSTLNTSDGRHRWRKRLEAILGRGAAELGLLRIDQEVAAYILGAVDGSTYRVLEGCYLTQWGRYAPGRLIESVAIQRFLDKPELTIFDWMTHTAPESLIAVNHREPTVILCVDQADPGD